MSRVARLPATVAVIALCAAALRMIPFFGARALTPPGWTFTGNLTNSPDYMQYRVWFQQTQVEGPVVTNVFTSEPNRPHLLLLFQYVVGKVGAWASVRPEYVYAYAGAVLAMALVVVLWLTVRRFVPDTYQAWWIFGALLLGGGFGAHLKLLTRFESTKQNLIVKRVLFEPLQEWLVFEDLRGHYLFTTLFDTHFLLLWVVALGCMLAMYTALRDCRVPVLLVLAALCGSLTLVHLYEGVLLVTVAAAVAVLCWIKDVARREALVVLSVVTAASGLALGWQFWLVLHAGIPAPDWRGQNVLVSILFLAYPLFWIFAVRGVRRYWREPSLDTLFLLGWAGGCTLLTLSGPFYPYPDRGTLTLMVPIGLLAGLAYFREFQNVTGRAAVIAALVLLPTPLWYLAQMTTNMRFRPEWPSVYMDQAHREIADALDASATRDDVLLADRASLLWLAPGYAGRHYCGHFFLTVDFERKQREVERFYAGSSEFRSAFLRDRHIKYVFVDARQDPASYRSIAGLRTVRANQAGAIFEYQSQVADGTR